MAEICVVRNLGKSWDQAVTFRVVVDNQIVGALAVSGSLTCPVSPGLHRVQVRSPDERVKSKVVEVDLDQTQNVSLDCWTGFGMAYYNPFRLGNAFYIKLRLMKPKDTLPSME